MEKFDIKKTVANNLKQARLAKGYNQEKVAEMLNTKQTIYSRYETAKLELDYEKIVILCKLLDMTPNELFENCI